MLRLLLPSMDEGNYIRSSSRHDCGRCQSEPPKPRENDTIIDESQWWRKMEGYQSLLAHIQLWDNLRITSSAPPIFEARLLRRRLGMFQISVPSSLIPCAIYLGSQFGTSLSSKYSFLGLVVSDDSAFWLSAYTQFPPHHNHLQMNVFWICVKKVQNSSVCRWMFHHYPDSRRLQWWMRTFISLCCSLSPFIRAKTIHQRHSLHLLPQAALNSQQAPLISLT